MEKSTKRADQYKKWRGIIAEQEASGLSRAEFCKQNNLSKSNFSYYAAKLRISCNDTNQAKNKPGQLFSPVKIKNPEMASSEITIILPNGFQCVVPNAIEVLQVQKLMEVLLSC